MRELSEVPKRRSRIQGSDNTHNYRELKNKSFSKIHKKLLKNLMAAEMKDIFV